jgi:hypothetical protein
MGREGDERDSEIEQKVAKIGNLQIEIPLIEIPFTFSSSLRPSVRFSSPGTGN